MVETILQHWIVTQFILPFTLVFALVYAILLKTKLLGEGNQVNAIIAGVIGLIFVSALEPKLIVENMMLFLAVAIVIVFVVLLLWGFVSGGDKGFEIANIDATIFAEAPKISPYREVMQTKIAQVLHIRQDRVNIKATTTEGLGVIGKGEGMGAMCVVLLNEVDNTET